MKPLRFWDRVWTICEISQTKPAGQQASNSVRFKTDSNQVIGSQCR